MSDLESTADAIRWLIASDHLPPNTEIKWSDNRKQLILDFITTPTQTTLTDAEREAADLVEFLNRLHKVDWHWPSITAVKLHIVLSFSE